LLTETTSTSETSVNFYQTTRRNNPEDSHPHEKYSEPGIEPAEGFRMQKKGTELVFICNIFEVYMAQCDSVVVFEISTEKLIVYA
jgi:hypothetical protein